MKAQHMPNCKKQSDTKKRKPEEVPVHTSAAQQGQFNEKSNCIEIAQQNLHNSSMLRSTWWKNRELSKDTKYIRVRTADLSSEHSRSAIKIDRPNLQLG
jgi:hypothetical protein